MATKNNPTEEAADGALVITRVFDAPRELVFKAYTDPNLIPQWWGPRGYTTTVDKMDVRPGGVWRFVQRGPDGNEYAFNGVYREIVPTERLAYTFEFEGMPGHVLLETVTFEEHDGKTKVTATALFDTVEDRDGMLKSGMEGGRPNPGTALPSTSERWRERHNYKPMRGKMDSQRSKDMAAGKIEKGSTGAGATATSGREFVITRVFDAPRELVWTAHTESERLMHW